MKKLTIAIFVLCLMDGIAFCNSESRIFGSVEAFGVGGINDPFEKETQEIVDILNDDSIPSSGSTKTSPGYGARIGWLIPTENEFEIGVSAGAIVGPQIVETIDTSVGQIKVDHETFFLRFLLEGGKKIIFPSGSYMRFGAGAGIATGNVKQSFSASGAISSLLVSYDLEEKWSGFTWEMGPSFIIPTDTAELEIGLHYSQFPKKSESLDIAAINWTPFSLFLTVRFGNGSAGLSDSRSNRPTLAGRSNQENIAVGENSKAHDFIVVGYNNIIQDLSKGGGPHLNSLLDHLSVTSADRPLAIKKIRGLSEAYPNISEFATHVVSLSFQNSEPVESAGSNEKQMTLSELRDYFHSLSNGTRVRVVLISDEKMDIVYDRFDGRNLNMIWCCKGVSTCSEGSGGTPLWLSRVKYVTKPVVP